MNRFCYYLLTPAKFVFGHLRAEAGSAAKEVLQNTTPEKKEIGLIGLADLSNAVEISTRRLFTNMLDVSGYTRVEPKIVGMKIKEYFIEKRPDGMEDVFLYQATIRFGESGIEGVYT